MCYCKGDNQITWRGNLPIFFAESTACTIIIVELVFSPSVLECVAVLLNELPTDTVPLVYYLAHPIRLNYLCSILAPCYLQLSPHLLCGNCSCKYKLKPIQFLLSLWYTVLSFAYILQFWRGTLGEANEAFASRQPKGEITILIEGKLTSDDETPSEEFLEHELRELTSKGHTLSAVHMLNWTHYCFLSFQQKLEHQISHKILLSGNRRLIISKLLVLNCRRLNWFPNLHQQRRKMCMHLHWDCLEDE